MDSIKQRIHDQCAPETQHMTAGVGSICGPSAVQQKQFKDMNLEEKVGTIEQAHREIERLNHRLDVLTQDFHKLYLKFNTHSHSAQHGQVTVPANIL